MWLADRQTDIHTPLTHTHTLLHSHPWCLYPPPSCCLTACQSCHSERERMPQILTSDIYTHTLFRMSVCVCLYIFRTQMSMLFIKATCSFFFFFIEIAKLFIYLFSLGPVLGKSLLHIHTYCSYPHLYNFYYII